MGRTRFAFAQRDVAAIPSVEHPTRSGVARVSTVAATAFDIAADVRLAGGIDNVATVILELAELEPFAIMDVATLAPRFPTSAGRRLGWVLARFAGRDDLGPLHAAVRDASRAPSRLDPSQPANGLVDDEWMLYLNRDVEPDA